MMCSLPPGALGLVEDTNMKQADGGTGPSALMGLLGLLWKHRGGYSVGGGTRELPGGGDVAS